MSIVNRGIGRGSVLGAGFGSVVVWGYGRRLVAIFQEVVEAVLCIVRRVEADLG